MGQGGNDSARRGVRRVSEASVSVGAFVIPPDHPCFPGHMPGHPLVPGALLLDRALALIAAHGLVSAPPGPVAAKFLSPVGPGETVAVRCQPSRSGGLGFEGHVEGRPVFTGRILAGPRGDPP